jgi:hypothetical protein
VTIADVVVLIELGTAIDARRRSASPATAAHGSQRGRIVALRVKSGGSVGSGSALDCPAVIRCPC